jgi:L-threonylcarbamoyladenylate synthase
MKTKIIRISSPIMEKGKIREIVEVLRRDGIMVYPTETFYGLGANGFSANAIRKVYRLKKRDLSKPLPVVISDYDMLRHIISGDTMDFEQLISDFWPGPLTIIFRASSAVPEELCGKDGTIGVRLTEHPWVRDLVSQAGFPITATSANISGQKPISDPATARELFEGTVDLFVDGGTTKGLSPSTVVDFSGEKPRLVREGAIPFNRLKKHWLFLPDKTS